MLNGMTLCQGTREKRYHDLPTGFDAAAFVFTWGADPFTGFWIMGSGPILSLNQCFHGRKKALGLCILLSSDATPLSLSLMPSPFAGITLVG